MPQSSSLTDDTELFERIGSVSPRQACILHGVGLTRLYELINSGELESYLDGKARRITVRSLVARRNRLLAASSSRKRNED